MNLYDIASKHGIPETKEGLIELLKGLVVDEEVVAKMLCDLYAPQRLNVYFDHEGVAKALANSTEIIKKGEK